MWGEQPFKGCATLGRRGEGDHEQHARLLPHEVAAEDRARTREVGAAAIAVHRGHGALLTMTAVRPPARFGHVELDGDVVSEFSEKPQTGEGWLDFAETLFEADRTLEALEAYREACKVAPTWAVAYFQQE